LGSDNNPAFAGGIAIDKAGNIAVVGMFQIKVAFGSEASTTTTASQALFLARRSAAGDKTDITELGTSEGFSPVGQTPAMALAFDPHGNLVVTAPFVGELYGLGRQNTGPKEDVFVAKFASALAAPTSLQLLWIQVGEESTASDNAQQPFGLAIDENQIAVTGITASDMKFAGEEIIPKKVGTEVDGFVGVLSP
jgi:hypothetical protein